jgi:2-oxoisovalerate dehydrogenase E1 component beta subunit
MTTTMSAALHDALHDALEADERTMLIGEDIGRLGGVFRVTAGLLDAFGPERVVDSPLGEAGIVGTAIGLALAGYRPICEIQFDGFVFPAMNQITTQLAKMHHRSQGALQVPVVIRIPYAGGIGAVEHHSESPEAYFTHTPGLRVVTCATPQDAYALLRAAIDCPDPVIFFEPKSRYWDRGEVDREQQIDIATANLVRPGDDVLLVTYGAGVKVAVAAAEELDDRGVSAAVVDLRSLSPLDMDSVIPLAEHTGRVVIVHEASLSGGVGAEVAARIAHDAFYSIQVPIERVTGYDTPYPQSKLEHWWLPNADRIVTTVEHMLNNS